MKLLHNSLRLLALTALLLCAAPQLWAQDTPPSDAHGITLTVLHGKYIAMRVMVSGEQTFWVETTPGEFLKRTITDEWSTKEGFLSNGTTMKVYGNITGFDIQNNSDDITGIDVTECPNLKTLIASNNGISSLNLSNNRQLSHLTCDKNHLTTLDVSKNTKLGWLECQKNQLTSLNLSCNTLLSNLNCHSNAFTADALNAIYCSLMPRLEDHPCNLYPALTTGDEQLAQVLASNADIATNKGWSVKYADGTMGNITTTGTGTCQNATPPAKTPYITFTINKDGWNLNYISLAMASASENTMAWVEVEPGIFHNMAIGTSWKGEMNISLGKNTSFRVYGNLTGLDCSANKSTIIKGIDISSNPGLQELNCAENPIDKLTIGDNSQLTKLICYNNDFNLEELYCSLPTRNANDKATIYLAENNTSDYLNTVLASNADIAKGKGWKVLFAEDDQEIQTTGTLTCDQLTPPANAPVITLTTPTMPEITKITPSILTRLKAAANNTIVWIERMPGVYKIFTIGTEGKVIDIPTSTNGIIKIYGDIIDFDCSNNHYGITTLDISGNPLLEGLNCSFNMLTRLNVGANPNLKILVCANTMLSTSALNNMYCSLPVIAEGSSAIVMPAGNNMDANYRNVEKSNAKIAREKGWDVDFAAEEGAIPTTGTTTCEELTPPANTPVISMSIASVPMGDPFIDKDPTGSRMIRFALAAAAENTPVWIETAPGLFETITVGSTPMPIELPIEGINSINIHGNITNFNCSQNYIFITSLNVSGNALLQEIICNNTFIGSLNLSKNTALTHLDCTRTGISTLDLTHNTALTHLACNDNLLNTVNVSQNTKLEYLQIINNQTTELDLSHNPELEYLNCSRNSLTSLNLSNNSKLTHIEAYSNLFSTAAIDGIYCSLPTQESSAEAKIVLAPIDPNYDMATVMATNAKNAQDKGWAVVVINNTPINTTGSYTCGTVGGVRLSNSTISMLTGKEYTLTAIIEPLGAGNQSVTWTSSNTDVATVTNGLVTAVSVGTATITATTVERGYSATCEVTVIDALPANTPVITITTQENVTIPYLSMNTEQANTPVWVEASAGVFLLHIFNGWTNIDNITVSGTTLKVHGAITGFTCSNNYDRINAIDISGNAGLKELFCHNNAITSLNASQNPALRTLFIFNNPFSTHALNDLYCSLPYIEEPNHGMLVPVETATDANHAEVVASNTNIAVSRNWSVAYAPIMGMPSKKTNITPVISTGTYVCGTVYEVLISEASKTIKVDETFTLTASVLPVNADNMEVTWTSSNTAVATVENGVVKGLTAGTTTITVTTTDGGYTATCEVTVTANVGVDDPKALSLTLYPNPTNGKVYIKGLTAPTYVQVYSAAGIQMINTLLQPYEMLDATGLKPGIYIVRVNGQSLKLSKN